MLFPKHCFQQPTDLWNKNKLVEVLRLHMYLDGPTHFLHLTTIWSQSRSVKLLWNFHQTLSVPLARQECSEVECIVLIWKIKAFHLPYIAQICKITAVYVITSEHGIQWTFIASVFFPPFNQNRRKTVFHFVNSHFSFQHATNFFIRLCFCLTWNIPFHLLYLLLIKIY